MVTLFVRHRALQRATQVAGSLPAAVRPWSGVRPPRSRTPTRADGYRHTRGRVAVGDYVPGRTGSPELSPRVAGAGDPGASTGFRALSGFRRPTHRAPSDSRRLGSARAGRPAEGHRSTSDRPRPRCRPESGAKLWPPAGNGFQLVLRASEPREPAGTFPLDQGRLFMDPR
jgi:hypothetical protein